MPVYIKALVLSVFVLGTLVNAGLFDHSNVLKLDDGNFDEKVGDGKIHFIKFYAPWCGHCKKLAPTWSQLAEEYKNNDKVSIDQIDCTNAKTVCEKAEVRGYPTLKAYLNGEQHAVFKGGRSIETLREYINAAVRELTLETVS